MKDKKNEMDDFEILKKIVKNEIDIENLDNNSKKRVRELCEAQIKEVKSKIDQKDEEIELLKKKLKK